MGIAGDVIYQYDGSFEGLLCCVFRSYTKREIPQAIVTEGSPQLWLLEVKHIETNSDEARRVLQSIPLKIGQEALLFIRQAFLTCLPDKELYILRFLRLGYVQGARVLDMLTEDSVAVLQRAVKHLLNESHLLKGFIRFSIINNVLAAEIEPKNCVLPLLSKHFRERYPEERFFIYDRTHGMALVYQPYACRIIPVDDFIMPPAEQEEADFRRLWQIFYDTIEIKGRHNPRCRMSHMPKRYWKYMTEFSGAAGTVKAGGELSKEKTAFLPAKEDGQSGSCKSGE